MKDSTLLQKELIEAWHANNRINLFLIDKISGEGMRCSLSTRGGKSVARQFTHMHNVRLWQLESRAKDLSKGLYKFGPKEEPSKKELKMALKESTKRIEEYLERILTGEGKARGFRRGIFTTLSYFVAHESHHRGSILLTLKQSGHKLDQKFSYTIWDWDKI
jgi:uncharacterized damage-inducible protein DinB